jgi:hypothetical protein
VKGDPGQLWGDEPTPLVPGGESFQRWVGRGGPAAQQAYFRRNRSALTGMRIAGLAMAGVVVAAALAVVFR